MVQTIDSDRFVNVAFDLCFCFLILRMRSYRFFFLIQCVQTILATTMCIRIERVKVTMWQQINPPDIKD